MTHIMLVKKNIISCIQSFTYELYTNFLSFPTAELDWLKDGEPLNPSDRMIISTTGDQSNFVIDTANQTDQEFDSIKWKLNP